MKRHEWWRTQYHADPYMCPLGETALRARLRDVTSNTCTVTDDLKLGMLSSAVKGREGTDLWMIAFTHLMEEWSARGQGLPGDIDRSFFADLGWPGLGSAVAPFQLSRQSHPEVLVRYGNAAYMNEALHTGKILIRPASSYNDASLNPAVRDDELELTVYRRSKLYDLLLDQYGSVLRPVGPVFGVKTEVLKAPTDFYVYCLCMQRSLRMFGDFKADSALIIHDTKTFIRRLGERVREYLGPGWSWMAKPIRYVDPLRAAAGPLDIVECKHFSYTYQHEYRLIWLPEKPVAQLNPFFVQVPPLRDCSQLVELSENA